jgi:hypothetical protein
MYVIRCLMKQARSHTVPGNCWLERHPPSHQSPHLQKSCNLHQILLFAAGLLHQLAWLVHPKKAFLVLLLLAEWVNRRARASSSTTRPTPADIEPLPPPISLPSPSRAARQAPALDPLPMSLAHVRFPANHSVQATGIEELDYLDYPGPRPSQCCVESYPVTGEPYDPPGQIGAG